MISGDSSVRATKAFCVGQAKSGTVSLCGLLATHHRAAHEPEREQTLDMILRESRGEVDANAFRAYLIERDQRLNLDYDISWANQFILSHLLGVFPNAKFIVLIRDAYTWVQSTVGHMLSREIPLDVRSFLDWWFKPDRYPHSGHDRVLEKHNLYSTAAFLNAWNQHVNVCTKVIPIERRLILRTHELNRSHRCLAEFLQIPIDSLAAGDVHLNRSTWSGKIDSLVKRSCLNEMVATICGENMARYFPEVTQMEQVYTLWEPGTPKG